MMISILKDVLSSKKAIAAIAGVIVALLSRVGLHLDVESVAAIVAPIVAYILGQGLADNGKEAVYLESVFFRLSDSAARPVDAPNGGESKPAAMQVHPKTFEPSDN